MAVETFDVIVLGGGPGGYVAAIRAAQRGYRTACIDVAQLGGVCNNVGCIPTKALLESAAYAARVEHLADFGITVGEVRRDLAQAARRARQVADQGARGVAYLFRKHGVEFVPGWGRLVSGAPAGPPFGGSGTHRVAVGAPTDGVAGNPIGVVGGAGGRAVAERVLEARHVILATGSRAKGLPMLRPDGDRVWSSDQAVYPPTIPASLVVVGAGAVGMEFADVYASFGARVTVVEAADRVLPVEDAEVSAVVEKAYTKRGIAVHTGVRLERTEVGADGVRVHVTLRDGAATTLEAERVLAAVGRAPVTEGIGLAEAGVAFTERGFVKVDARMRTNVPGLYAIGDLAGGALLAHKAWAEAAAVVGGIAQDPYVAVDYGNVPSVTYCHPEVASVGLTEAAARAEGFEVSVGKFPWSANGRARVMGETDGFVKVVRNARYGELLGAHLVGPHASELIGEFVLGRLLETTVEDLELAVHPHPTLSDAIPEAALDSLGRAVHL